MVKRILTTPSGIGGNYNRKSHEQNNLFAMAKLCITECTQLHVLQAKHQVSLMVDNSPCKYMLITLGHCGLRSIPYSLDTNSTSLHSKLN